MNGPDKERAAVVAYLRECQALHERFARSEGTKKGAHNYHAKACRNAAIAIESGEHWFKQGGVRRYV